MLATPLFFYNWFIKGVFNYGCMKSWEEESKMMAFHLK